jgi:hypothetical protein
MAPPQRIQQCSGSLPQPSHLGGAAFFLAALRLEPHPAVPGFYRVAEPALRRLRERQQPTRCW